MKPPIRIEVLGMLIHAILAMVIVISYVVVYIIKGQSDPNLVNIMFIAITSLFGTVALSHAANKNSSPSDTVTPAASPTAPAAPPQTITNVYPQSPKEPTQGGGTV